MDPMDIIEEYNARSRSARNYREVGLLLLVVAVIVFALYAIYRARVEFWGGIILAAGIILLVVSFALAMLSLLKLRCPNCSRVLSEVPNAAYCPACGVPLKDDGSFGKVPAAGVKPRRPAAAERALARRAWEPRSLAAGSDEFPEEAYPKNIRMFTTTDETELTKRYLHLIHRDDTRRPQEEIPPRAKDARAPDGRMKADESTARPEWRTDKAASENDAVGTMARRLINLLRVK